MRLPAFDLSRLNPRRLFQRNRGPQPAVPAAGSRSLLNPAQGGTRPAGDASTRVPADRLPPAAPASPGDTSATPAAHANPPASPRPPAYEPSSPIDIPAPRAAGTRSHVRFTGEDLDAHDGGEAVQNRPRSGTTSSTRSNSPPPGYETPSQTGTPEGSPPNPFGTHTPPPNYQGVRLHDGEHLLGHDGLPIAYPDPEGSPRPGGNRTPSPLEIGTTVLGRPASQAFSGSPSSMNSEQLEAYLNSLPPLSRFPTPPPANRPST